jgi:hypothetical protein
VYAPIAAERLTKAYHWRWHWMHGKHAAAMHLQEIIDRRGHLLRDRRDAPRLFGTPGHVFRALGSHLAGWVRALTRLHADDARCHAHRVCYFIAYIRANAARESQQGLRMVLLDVFAFVRHSLGRASAQVKVSVPRIVLVHVLLAGLVGGSAYDIYTGREHWPLSPYPMFSSVERTYDLRAFRMVGVTADAESREVPVRDYGMLEPLDQCRVATAFARTANNARRRHLVDEMLRDRLKHYERHRLAGNHDGPPLAALRLYDSFWLLDPMARNADSPDRQTLVAEVTPDTSPSTPSGAH